MIRGSKKDLPVGLSRQSIPRWWFCCSGNLPQWLFLAARPSSDRSDRSDRSDKRAAPTDPQTVAVIQNGAPITCTDTNNPGSFPGVKIFEFIIFLLLLLKFFSYFATRYQRVYKNNYILINRS